MIAPWLYNDAEFEPDVDPFGFIYLISNNLTDSKYIGKKLCTSASTKTVDGKKKKVRKLSDWRNYWGSSRFIKEDIQQHGKENFTRAILHLCDSRSELNYLENWEIFSRHALLKTGYHNHWTTVQITDKHLGKVKEKYRGILFTD